MRFVVIRISLLPIYCTKKNRCDIYRLNFQKLPIYCTKQNRCNIYRLNIKTKMVTKQTLELQVEKREKKKKDFE